MKKILVLHGPNLNLLGRREPQQYGVMTLEQINASLETQAKDSGLHLTARQSNHEGQLVDWIQAAGNEKIDYIILNPAAFTHTSIAIRDALLAVTIPFIEVHLSNIYSRETFRHHSYVSDIAQGVISGLGPQGYRLALQAIIEKLK